MIGLTQDRVTRIDVRREPSKDLQGLRGGVSAEREPLLRSEGPATILDFRQNSDVLVRTVEREVIPRLMVAHRPGCAARVRDDGIGLPDRADVVELTGLIASCDTVAVRSRIEAKRAQGMSLETIYLYLLVPAARRLADLWEADLCQYEEIAVGMLCLRQILHESSAAFSSGERCQSRGRKALLVSAPGEQNMLGVFMVSEFCRCMASEFFHRAGWEVWRAPPASRAQMLDVVRSNWFDVVDISASCEGRMPSLTADIAEIRKISRNREVSVIVGGPVFSDHPEFSECVAADASACDARDTLLQAEALIERRGLGNIRSYY